MAEVSSGLASLTGGGWDVKEPKEGGMFGGDIRRDVLINDPALGGAYAADSSATANAAKSAATANRTDSVELSGLTVNAPSLVNDGDVHFFGGELTGRYGKRGLPRRRGSYPVCAYINPPRHLQRWSRAGTSAIATVVGDSTSTVYANANTRRDTLAGMFESALMRDNPDRALTYVPRGIGGTTYTELNTGPGGTPPYTVNALYSWWYTNTANDWLTYIQASNPDLLLMHFGMNDKQNFSWLNFITAITKIKAWSKVPDLVFGTALQPTSVAPNSTFGQDVEQDGRDMAAGLVRTYALMNNHAVLDFNRAYNLLVRGLDPVGTHSVRVLSDAAVTLPYVAASDYSVGFSDRNGGTETRTVLGAGRDYSFDLKVNSIPTTFWDPSGAGTQKFKIRLSGKLSTQNATAQNDLIVWRDSSTGRLFYNVRMDIVSGTTYWLFGSDQDSGVTAPTSGNIWIRFHLSDGGLIRLSLISADGIQETVVINRRVARFGGCFQGAVGYDGSYAGSQAGTLTWYIGESNRYTPGMVSSDVWGDDRYPDVTDQIPYGGNGVNHPTSVGAAHVYGMVLAQADFSPAPVALDAQARTIWTQQGQTAYGIAYMNGATMPVLGAAAASGNASLAFASTLSGALTVRMYLNGGGSLVPANNNASGLGGTGLAWSQVTSTQYRAADDTVVIDGSKGIRYPVYTAASIAAAANAVNTTDKVAGKTIFDSTNNRLMVASGSTATSAWYVVDGSASVTPA